MTHDLFEQLADSDVPPVPPELDERVHHRLNAALLTTHLVEFAWHALPQTFGTLLSAVVHLIVFTITGTMRETSDSERPSGQ